MGRTRFELGPADGAGEVGQTELRAGRRPEGQEDDEAKADDPDRAGDEVLAWLRPSLPTHSPRHARTDTRVEEWNEQERADRDRRDDQRHDQLGPELQELEEKQEVPVGPRDGDCTRVGRLLELQVLLDIR